MKRILSFKYNSHYCLTFCLSQVSFLPIYCWLMCQSRCLVRESSETPERVFRNIFQRSILIQHLAIFRTLSLSFFYGYKSTDREISPFGPDVSGSWFEGSRFKGPVRDSFNIQNGLSAIETCGTVPDWAPVPYRQKKGFGVLFMSVCDTLADVVTPVLSLSPPLISMYFPSSSPFCSWRERAICSLQFSDYLCRTRSESFKLAWLPQTRR